MKDSTGREHIAVDTTHWNLAKQEYVYEAVSPTGRPCTQMAAAPLVLEDASRYMCACPEVNLTCIHPCHTASFTASGSQLVLLM